MLLHQIRTNYTTLPEIERLAHISRYRATRMMELENPIIPVKAKGKKTLEPKAPKSKLSPEEKALLKKLGLSFKSLKTLE
jgi:hypothetical protein